MPRKAKKRTRSPAMTRKIVGRVFARACGRYEVDAVVTVPQVLKAFGGPLDSKPVSISLAHKFAENGDWVKHGKREWRRVAKNTTPATIAKAETERKETEKAKHSPNIPLGGRPATKAEKARGVKPSELKTSGGPTSPVSITAGGKPAFVTPDKVKEQGRKMSKLPPNKVLATDGDGGFKVVDAGVQLSPADRGTLTNILNGVGDCLAKVDRLIADNAKSRPKTLADIGATSRDGTGLTREERVKHAQRHDSKWMFGLGVMFGALVTAFGAAAWMQWMGA